LLEGGVDVMEITLRHGSALAAIEAVARAVPQMHVGAGTVTRVADVQRVIDAGASFALSPGCTEALVQAVRAARLPFIPGVMTPSEVLAAREHGFTLMKLFPAAQAGGLAMLQALGAPIPDVQFCPTGGVQCGNAGQLSGPAQCGHGGRLVAHAGRCPGSGRLGAHWRVGARGDGACLSRAGSGSEPVNVSSLGSVRHADPRHHRRSLIAGRSESLFPSAR
jgi:Entner-Doudoroff aldolase